MTASSFHSSPGKSNIKLNAGDRLHLPWILIAMSLVFLSWIVAQYLWRPSWLSVLPSILLEMIALVQAATAVTLTIVWLIWFWRKWVTRDQIEAPDLEALQNLAPAEFERYVARLFRRRGYRVHVRGRSGDHGVDLEVTQRGGRRAIVQCKRYRQTVGPDIVRELYGTMIHENVHHAFLVTTASISESARLWARHKAITLIDGQALVEIAGELAGDGPSLVTNGK